MKIYKEEKEKFKKIILHYLKQEIDLDTLKENLIDNNLLVKKSDGSLKIETVNSLLESLLSGKDIKETECKL